MVAVSTSSAGLRLETAALAQCIAAASAGNAWWHFWHSSLDLHARWQQTTASSQCTAAAGASRQQGRVDSSSEQA